MRREEAAIAVITAAADEEYLHAALPGLLMHGDHIGIRKAGRVDNIAALDIGQAPQPVADGGGAFEFHAVGGFGHFRRQVLLDRAGFS